jgi:nitrite reductase/ring-hydroxylating ferredoxin subunit
MFAATADDVPAMRATIELRAAQPGASFPRSEFVAELHHRLSEELTDPIPGEVASGGRRVSRRTVLTGATGAAAAVLGAVVDHDLVTSPSRSAAQKELIADPGTWTPVAASSEIVTGKVVRFETTTAAGFVSRSGEQLRAVSGVCSHQGCLLALNETAGRLDCPCHRVSFRPSGEVLNHNLPHLLPSLPRLPVRERDGQVEVYLPLQG